MAGILKSALPSHLAPEVATKHHGKSQSHMVSSENYYGTAEVGRIADVATAFPTIHDTHIKKLQFSRYFWCPSGQKQYNMRLHCGRAPIGVSPVVLLDCFVYMGHCQLTIRIDVTFGRQPADATKTTASTSYWKGHSCRF